MDIASYILSKKYTDNAIKEQVTIDDISDIREGAKLGSTALQEVPDGYAKTEDIPTKMSELQNDICFGKLIIGNIVYDGTSDVEVPVYDGKIQ